MADKEFQYKLTLASEVDNSGIEQAGAALAGLEKKLQRVRELNQEAGRIGADGDYAEADKLRAEADKLYAEYLEEKAAAEKSYQEALKKTESATVATTKATKSATGEIKDNTVATKQNTTAVSKSAQTREQAAAKVKQNLRVVDDSTKATQKSSSALAQNISRLKSAGLAAAASAAAWNLVKRVQEDISRRLGFYSDEIQKAADKEAELAVKALESAKAQEAHAKALAESTEAAGDEIERLTGLLATQIEKIDESTAAFKKNAAAQNAIKDAELERDIAAVESDSSLTEAQRLEKVAALRKRHAAERVRSSAEVAKVEIDAAREIEAAARNRLAIIPDVERDRVGNVRQRADAYSSDALKKRKQAARLGSTKEASAGALDDILFEDDNFAKDRKDFTSVDDYIAYVEERLNDFEARGQIGTGSGQLDPKVASRAKGALSRTKRAGDRQKSLTESATQDEAQAAALNSQADSSQAALDAEKKRLQGVRKAQEERIQSLREEVALQERLAKINSETQSIRTKATVAKAVDAQKRSEAADQRKSQADPLREGAAAAGALNQLATVASQSGDANAASSAAEIAAALRDGKITEQEMAKIAPMLKSLSNAQESAFQGMIGVVHQTLANQKGLQAQIAKLQNQIKLDR